MINLRPGPRKGAGSFFWRIIGNESVKGKLAFFDDYRLFQVADLICTLEHISGKIEIGQFSKTEADFFTGRREFKRDYLRKLQQQRM